VMFVYCIFAKQGR